MAADFENSLGKVQEQIDRYYGEIKKLTDRFGQIPGLPKLSSFMPSIPDIRKTFAQFYDAYSRANESILGPAIGSAAARVAQSLVLVNSVVNGIGLDGVKLNIATGRLVYSKNGITIDGANVSIDSGTISYAPEPGHLAAVDLFVMRTLGYKSSELDKAGITLLSRDGDNPFFEYLANGRTSRLLQLIVQKCPSMDRPSVSRYQWFPERGEGLQAGRNKTAWAESMYWDCIFLGEISEHDVTAALADETQNDDPFTSLIDPWKNARMVIDNVVRVTGVLSGAIDEINRKVGDLLSKVPPRCITIEQCGRDIFCGENPDNTICKITPDIHKLCPCSGLLCPC